MTAFTEPERCAICGNTDRRDLRYALAHWREAALGMAYEHLLRCVDRSACRRRIEQAGDTWPLVEVKSDRVAS